MEQDKGWQARVAAGVGRRVAWLRGRSASDGGRLTAQALADRCEALGLTLGLAIAKLEKGLRDTITVGELMVLARALDVPPVLLIFPLGTDEPAEPLPGAPADPWDAIRWFSGQLSDPADPGSRVSGRDPIALWGRHEQAERNIATTVQARSAASPAEGDVALADWAARVQRAAEDLRQIRDDIRALGLAPPPLSPLAAAVTETES